MDAIKGLIHKVTEGLVLPEEYVQWVAIVLVFAFVLVKYRKFKNRTKRATYMGKLDANGKRVGEGELKLVNGDIYVGSFKDHKYHGQGAYTFKNGGSYTGQFYFGSYNGKGQERYPDGSIYAGQFKDNCRHGQGRLELASGTSYEGQWVNGKREGRGTETSDKEVYDGEWTAGRRNGTGFRTDRRNKERSRVQYQNGHLVDPAASPQ